MSKQKKGFDMDLFEEGLTAVMFLVLAVGGIASAGFFGYLAWAPEPRYMLRDVASIMSVWSAFVAVVFSHKYGSMFKKGGGE